MIVLASSDPRQEQNGILAECKRSETATQVKAEKSVKFSAEALIFDAALEGDLELLKCSFEKVSVQYEHNNYISFLSLRLEHLI